MIQIGRRREGGALLGKTVVITGTLPTLSRAAATKLVESHGGRVTSSVSRATSFVVAGEEPGRVRIIDASGSPEEVTERLLEALSDLLP